MSEIKKYLLFGGSNFYAEGGADDFVTSADTIKELQDWFDENRKDIAGYDYDDCWGQIVEHQTMKPILYAEHKWYSEGSELVPPELEPPIYWHESKDLTQ